MGLRVILVTILGLGLLNHIPPSYGQDVAISTVAPPPSSTHPAVPRTTTKFVIDSNKCWEYFGDYRTLCCKICISNSQEFARYTCRVCFGEPSGPYPDPDPSRPRPPTGPDSDCEYLSRGPTKDRCCTACKSSFGHCPGCSGGGSRGRSTNLYVLCTATLLLLAFQWILSSPQLALQPSLKSHASNPLSGSCDSSSHAGAQDGRVNCHFRSDATHTSQELDTMASSLIAQAMHRGLPTQA